MLQSFNETGRIGIQAPGPDSVAGEAGPLVSPASLAQQMEIIGTAPTAPKAPRETPAVQVGNAPQRLDPAQPSAASPNLAPMLGGELETTPLGGMRLRRLEPGQISKLLTNTADKTAPAAKPAPTAPAAMETGSDHFLRMNAAAIAEGVTRGFRIMTEQSGRRSGEGGVF